VLSQNQNQDKLSSKIKRRLDKKLNELNNLEGGESMAIGIIKKTIFNYINMYKGTNNNELKYILTYIFDEIFKENTLKKLTTKIINSFKFKALVKNNINTIIDLFHIFKKSSFNLGILKIYKQNIISILQQFVEEIINNLIENNYIQAIIEDKEIIKLISNIEGNVKNEIWKTVSFGLINFGNNNNSKVQNKIMFSNTIIDIITSKLNNYSGQNNKELTKLLTDNFDLIFGNENSMTILINKIIKSFKFKKIIVKNIGQIIDLFNLLKDKSFDINVLNTDIQKNKIIKIVQEFIEEILAKLDTQMLDEIFNDEIVLKLIDNIESQMPGEIFNSLSSGFTTFFNYSDEKRTQIIKQQKQESIEETLSQEQAQIMQEKYNAMQNELNNIREQFNQCNQAYAQIQAPTQIQAPVQAPKKPRAFNDTRRMLGL
jgi:hypothetical protein